MKKFLFAACLSLVVSCAGLGTSNKIKLAAYRDVTLSNGLKVLIVEDHSLPYISVGMLIRSGASQDPATKSGLADMTAELLERGTKNKNATQIADGFGQLGTAFSADTGYDYTYLSTAGLAANQEELLDLFFEVVTQATFSVNEVNRTKSEMIGEIKRGYDQPGYVADRLFAEMLFGPHPYGRSVNGSVRDVQTIKQKDVIRHYLKAYRPNNALLVLVGDLNKNIISALEGKLVSWSPRDSQNEKLQTPRPQNGFSIQLVNRDDLKQSEVRMGHYGVKRQIEDYQALTVAETILSGGFTSRLMGEIRVKRGLTYGIRSAFDARQEPGPFIISANTRHEKVGELVEETLKTLTKFHKEGVSEHEVENAKGYLRGLFPHRVETSDQMARMLVALRFYGIDDEYMSKYIRNLNKISVSDVNKVIEKYYHPEQVKVLIYAPKNKVIEQLRPLGAVEVRDYRELL